MTDKNIIYIGANDTDLDLFESQYIIPEGISYNSYLIIDEKIAVMDTVDKRKSREYLYNLTVNLAGRKPEYLIISHAEPDHASGIQSLLELYPDITLVGNSKTFLLLDLYLKIQPQNTLIVKEGDTLSLGQHRLTFFTAPMVHWPEVMVTYEAYSKTLFSADAFGTFGARTAEICQSPNDWLCEARRYYFNIVGKYGGPVQSLLKKTAPLDIQTIASLHGPLLTGDLSFYLNKYDIWSRYLPETEGVFIAYASFHGNTASAALLLKSLLLKNNCPEVNITDLARDDMSEAVENAFRYSKIVLAAPSYDGGLMPFMADFLHHLKSKNFQNRKIALIENGSWSPCAGKIMTDILACMKDITFLYPTVTVQGSVKPSDISQIEALSDSLTG